MKIFTMVLLTGVLSAGVLSPLHAAQNMIGRQSQNEGMLVLPTPGKVSVDGDLKDWDWSGRIWVFADSAVRERFSVEASAMWDKENLYLAAKWKDPTPMFSLIDPAINPNEGWKEDAWQMRVLTDHPLWITTWYYTTQKQPALHIARWKDPTNERNGVDAALLVAKPDAIDLGEGVQMAYRKDDDGKGFSQEIKIPWRLLYKTMPEIKPGLTLRLGNEFLWGDPTGVTFPIHRYADNMQPGHTSREFYWSAQKSWGDARLVEKGNVPIREYIGDGARVEGTIPVRVTIPKDAARFTVVIEDGRGDRVRTLAADADPADYAVAGKDTAQARVMEVKWDGLDDKGRMASPGNYKVRGLTHRGLGAEYEMSYYNPGTPPWPTVDGRGGWGADHTAPIAVASGGDWTLVTWPVVEGGSGIIGLDATGQKRWADKRGIPVVTADDKYAYGYVTGWYVEETICRFDIKTGATKPFILDGKERTFDLPLKEILGIEESVKVTGLAVHGNQLVIAFNKRKIAVLDAASARVLRQFDAPGVSDIAFSRDGKLYGLLKGEVQLHIDLDTGEGTTVFTPGVQQPVALAVDLDGNLVIADAGPDSQVKAFSPDGKLVYTAGKKGGRPIRGAFDEQAMSHLSSVAVDKQGRIWTVENWNYPRRVASWGRDGKLVREYLGNTGYAGTGSFLHDQDPTLGYVGPLEFKLNKSSRSWKLQHILWEPDKTQGESFQIYTGDHELAQRFSRVVNGRKREYLFTHDADVQWGTGNVVFMERNGRWQPVAAICMAIHISGKALHRGGVVLEQPTGELAGLNAYDGIIWSDDNRDGKVQRAECTVVKTTQPGDEKRGGRSPLPLNNGWGARIGDDFSIFADGITRYKPLRLEDDGAPVYGLESKSDLGVPFNGDFVPVPGEDKLIALATGGSAASTLQMVNLKTGLTEWTYPNPYPGVHGSHRATMPKPGLLIGPLKTCGVAYVNDQIGNVFLIRGNLGQDFLYTSDGLYVGAMFQDGRLPNESLPDKEEQLIGMPMETFSEGGEPFNGWFGKQSDGKIRLMTGMPRQAAMILEVKGLETIRRFEGSSLSVDQKQLIAADADNTARAKKAVTARQYTITRLAASPKIDGGEGDWKNVPELTIAREGQPDRATVKLGYDATNLYALFEVQDPTPWRNAGKDFANLFKTGDAVDIQLSTQPNAKAQAEPQAGDKRIVIAQFEKKPVAVLMAPVDKSVPANTAKSYTSPVGTKKFDRVEVLTSASVAAKSDGNRYRVEVSIPLQSLGLAPQSGQSLRGDIGFISSDAAGLINTARTYWSNSQTNLVNDEPLEAWLYPATWGELKFE